nr:hypothetical protein [Tanacetum cinerariifolium]
FEVGESSAAAAARQPGLKVTHATDYSFVDMWMPPLDGHNRTREPDPVRDPEPQDGPADAGKYEANRGRENGDDCHNFIIGERRQMPIARECTYNDFLKCQPLNFKGTEGVIGLTQWELVDIVKSRVRYSGSGVRQRGAS